MITKDQYECAMSLIRNYRKNPDFKAHGIEYMDDSEIASYELALTQIHEYGQQIAAYRREVKLIRIKGSNQ